MSIEIDRKAALSPHFLVGEAFNEKCDVNNLAVPFEVAFENAQFLAESVLEHFRTALNSPLGVNSWCRDIAFNAKLASDPAAAARVAKRPGPHTDGSAADVRIIKADKLDATNRNNAYHGAFVTLWNLVHGSYKLPVNEAILEYAKDNTRITHIHVQARKVGAKGRFVARKWVTVNGVQNEQYIAWKP